MKNQMTEWWVRNTKTGIITITSAVSEAKAANNVRYVNHELFYSLNDYEVIPNIVIQMRQKYGAR